MYKQKLQQLFDQYVVMYIANSRIKVESMSLDDLEYSAVFEQAVDELLAAILYLGIFNNSCSLQK